MSSPTTPLSKIDLAVEMVMHLEPTERELSRIIGKLTLEEMHLRPLSRATPAAEKVNFSR